MGLIYHVVVMIDIWRDLPGVHVYHPTIVGRHLQIGHKIKNKFEEIVAVNLLIKHKFVIVQPHLREEILVHRFLDSEIVHWHDLLALFENLLLRNFEID